MRGCELRYFVDSFYFPLFLELFLECIITTFLVLVC